MRKKNQIFRRQDAIKEPAHARHQRPDLYRKFRVTGDGVDDLLVFAKSPGEAEQIARRILGDREIYTKCKNFGDVHRKVKMIMDPDGYYEGELQVTLEGPAPATRSLSLS